MLHHVLYERWTWKKVMDGTQWCVGGVSEASYGERAGKLA
jgi:hypothetical protein